MLRYILPLLFVLSACQPQEADYAVLKWRDDVFYLAEQPFTGIARERHKKTGALTKEYPMQAGLIHGLMREWWDNGQLSAETNFDHGQRHGLNRYWDKTGKLIKEQVYEHNVSVSEKHF
jgi:hypothetical protein